VGDAWDSRGYNRLRAENFKETDFRRYGRCVREKIRC
jgi:hypothetical protein